MVFDDTASRIIATKNGNRNMVLALYQRVTSRHEQLFTDGLTGFGVPMIFGLRERVLFPCITYPYEWLPGDAKNDNIMQGLSV